MKGNGNPFMYYRPNFLRLCIDYNDDGRIGGRFYSPLTEEPVFFHDLVEFFSKADQLFDRKGYPQSFQNKKSFSPQPPCPSFTLNPRIERSSEDILSQKGALSTYDIMVQSRRNTNWQGFVFDSEGNRLGSYYDVLQIVDLLLAHSASKD